MKQPPTDRHRAIAALRSEGKTLQEVANTFHTNRERVRQITRRVDDYDRGMAMLREDPASLEALALIGRIPLMIRFQLKDNGIDRLTDLDGITEREMLRWPNFGRRWVETLFGLLAELKERD